MVRTMEPKIDAADIHRYVAATAMMQLDRALYRKHLTIRQTNNDKRFEDIKESIRRIRQLIKSNSLCVNSLHNYQKHNIALMCNVAASSPVMPENMHNLRRECIITKRKRRVMCVIRIADSHLKRSTFPIDKSNILEMNGDSYIAIDAHYTTFAQSVWFVAKFKTLVSEYISERFSSKKYHEYTPLNITNCTKLIGDFIKTMLLTDKHIFETIARCLLNSDNHIRNSIHLYISTCQTECKCSPFN
jgi:hypothetical protein